ncbi:MAG: FadR family transcriptional regulator [Rhizobiales bacterium]|nr:FadR family transcriptional regulator [Hyphomicrobiales bacterium]
MNTSRKIQKPDIYSLQRPGEKDRTDQERLPLLSDRLANDILDMIIANNLAPGDRLPTEGAIGELFQVSRGVVREAVRSLASRNIVETRRGAGPVVAAVPASAVSTSLSLYLRGRQIDLSYRNVHEARVAIEVEVAQLAAQRASHAAVGRMRDIFDEMESVLKRGEDMSKLDLDFHYEIANATGNEVFNMMLEPLVNSLLLVRQTTLGLPNAPESAHIAHRHILEAIAARDPKAAGAAMRRHLVEVLNFWTRSEEMHRADGHSTIKGKADEKQS